MIFRKTKLQARLAIRAVIIIVVATLGSVLPSVAFSEELTIAAAADLNFAFKDLVAEFEKKNGTHVKLSLGSSGNFYSQISNGAPFDLYFSADIRYPQKLEEAGYAVPGSLYQYAVGRIVLWVPKSSPLDVEKLGMQALLDPSVKRIAIANPKHAPYGRAAVAAMEHFKVYERLVEKFVYGENVAQTAQFVQSGAADIGIVALSLARAPSLMAEGKHWLIPADAHPTIAQGAVVLKSSKNEEKGKAFLEYLSGEHGRQVMASYGFLLPGPDGKFTLPGADGRALSQ